MPITKNYQTPNGATNTHHVIARLSLHPKAEIVINHYLAAPQPGGQEPPINWQATYPLDLAELSGPDFVASAEAWLISPAGPLAGGVIAEVSTPVQQLRAELIATAARRRKELRKIYTHDFGDAPEVEEGQPAPEGIFGMVPFDADEASAGNINAVLTAALITSLPPEFVVTYKCQDDLYRAIPLGGFQAMALGMLGYVQSLHARESELINLIVAAGDDAEALMALAPAVMAFLAPS